MADVIFEIFEEDGRDEFVGIKAEHEVISVKVAGGVKEEVSAVNIKASLGRWWGVVMDEGGVGEGLNDVLGAIFGLLVGDDDMVADFGERRERCGQDMRFIAREHEGDEFHFFFSCMFMCVL